MEAHQHTKSESSWLSKGTVIGADVHTYPPSKPLCILDPAHAI